MSVLVTAIVTAYNLEQYIAEAVESALGQSYTPLEVVVVDDGSTDRTGVVCARFADRIRYIRQANRGAAEARNTGVRHARGELIAFLDGDDVWRRDHVATLVAAAERFPESGLIATDGVEFTDGSVVVSDSLLTLTGAELLRRSGGEVWYGHCYHELLAGTPVSTTSQVMVPARVFERVGLWDPRFRLSQDYDLYLRIAATLPITLVGRRTVHWRRRPTSLSGPVPLRYFRWRLDDVSVLRKQLRLVGPEQQAAVRAQLRRKLLEVTRAAYYRSTNGRRLWAAGYLLRLAIASRRPHLVVPYLIGVVCPQRVQRLAGYLRHRHARRAERSVITAACGGARAGLSSSSTQQARE